MNIKNSIKVTNSYACYSILVGILFTACIYLSSSPSFAGQPNNQIVSNKVVNGFLKAAEVKKYTFEAAEDKSFVVNLVKTDNSPTDFRPLVKIVDPSGNVLMEGVEDLVYRAPIMKPPAGNWGIHVQRGDTGNTGGKYALRVIEAPGTQGQEIRLGQSASGALSQGDIDVYTIKGFPGALGDLAVSSKRETNAILEVTLFAPNGDMLGSSGCSEHCQMDLPVAEDGTYTILVWRGDKTSTKIEYVLKANMMPGMELPPEYAEKTMDVIKNMEPIASVAAGHGTKRFRFKALQPSFFIATLSEKGAKNPSFKPDLKIYDPHNNIVHAGSGEHFARFVVPVMAGGNWVLEAGNDNGGEGSGHYILSLVHAPGAKGKTITFNKKYTDKLLRGETDVFIVRGTPNVLSRMTLNPKGGKGFIPEIVVVAPNGELATQGGCSELCHIDFKMTEYGDYTVLIGRVDDSDQESTYELSVKRTDGKPELSEAAINKLFLNPTIPILPKQLQPMGKSAYVYRNNLFLPLSSKRPTKEDKRKASSGDALLQLFIGDCDIHDPSKWWKKAADQGSVLAKYRLAALSSHKNNKRASWYDHIVNQGARDREFKHANRFLNGCGYVQDFPRMKKEMLVLANKGVATAQYNLAVLHALGMKDKPDFVTAAKWYAKAAEQGLTVAINNLGELYEHGDGVTQSDSKALKLYQEAAKTGYPVSLYNWGRFAAAGRGMPKDIKKAKSLLRKAANEGHLASEATLIGLNGNKHLAALLWFKLAERGDMEALNEMVKVYREIGILQQKNMPVWGDKISAYLGKGTLWKDHDEVLRLYRAAALEVNPVAFVGLGDLFAAKKSPDYFEAYYWYSLTLDSIKDAYVPKDEKKALKKYAKTQASKMKKHLTPEQVAVTRWRIYDRNPSKPSDELKEAARLFLRGEEAYKGEGKSHDYFYLKAALMGLPRANMQIGANFTVRTRDYERARSFYKKAMMGGRVEMASWIAEHHHFGLGTKVDLEKAKYWYKLDASRGYKTAMDRLGMIYMREDRGDKAISMYEKAAARGIYQANNALGMIYLYGFGDVTPNHEKALFWYLKAVEAGSSVGAVQAAAILSNYEPYDYERALELLSSFGTPVALNNRGFMYEHGLGVKEKEGKGAQTSTTALELYKRSADMCYGRAMYNIGRLYEKGTSSPRVSKKAIKKDLKIARMWMEKAAVNGSRAAARWLEINSIDIEQPLRHKTEGSTFNEWAEAEISPPPKPCKKKGH